MTKKTIDKVTDELAKLLKKCASVQTDDDELTNYSKTITNIVKIIKND